MRPEEIAKIVTGFLDAFNQGDREALARFFGENFQMYTVGEHNRQTGQFRHDVYMVEQVISYDEVVRRPRREVINQLLDYFAARHEQHEQMHLLEIAAISEGGGYGL